MGVTAGAVSRCLWKDYVDVSVEGAWNHLFIINKTSRYGKGLFIIFCDVLAT